MFSLSFQRRGAAQLALLVTTAFVVLAFALGISYVVIQKLNSGSILATTSTATKVKDDATNKRVTVETGSVKAVFYYGGYNTAPNWKNEYQGGGNLYELYYKPTDPSMNQNLVATYAKGYDSFGGTAVGAGGIGNTQAYFLNIDPAVDRRFPYCGDNSKCSEIPHDEFIRLNDYISDNNSGFYESHYVRKNYPKANWTTVNFVFVARVRNTSSGKLLNDKPIYRVRKTWKISPNGNIYHLQKKELLRNVWMAEVGFRMQWNMERAWNTLRKWGHVVWLDHTTAIPKTAKNQKKLDQCLYGVDGYTGNSNSATCSAVSEYVVLKNLRSLTGRVTGECFLPGAGYPTEDRLIFQPSNLTIKGSPSAPDVKVIYDNRGTGFNGGGIWQALQYASSRTYRNAYMEQCIYDRRPRGDGAFALHFGFFSSSGGNDSSDSTGINFTLYCINEPSNNICKRHLVKSSNSNRIGVFTDSFIIKLKTPANKTETSDSADNSGFVADDINERDVFTKAELQ